MKPPIQLNQTYHRLPKVIIRIKIPCQVEERYASLPYQRKQHRQSSFSLVEMVLLFLLLLLLLLIVVAVLSIV